MLFPRMLFSIHICAPNKFKFILAAEIILADEGTDRYVWNKILQFARKQYLSVLHKYIIIK